MFAQTYYSEKFSKILYNKEKYAWRNPVYTSSVKIKTR